MASSEPELMTMSAYARHRGVSVPYIHKLKKAGKLPFVEGKIDPAVADAILNGSADPAKQVAKAPRALKLVPTEFAESPIAKATAKDRDASAEMKLLRLEQARGKVVDSDGVITAVADNQEAAINLLKAMPDRVASRVAAESDPRKVHTLLAKEIEAVCQNIAKSARAFQDKLVPSN